MNHVETALSCFAQGCSCSQAVATVFAEQFGLDRETMMKIASGFGGGMGRMGQTCGAVTGAFMILGLRFAPVSMDREAKEQVYERIREFGRQFQERHGSMDCRALLNCDLSTPEGRRINQEEKRSATICPGLVRDAVEMLETMLQAPTL